MTVEELITKLSKFPADAKVWFTNGNDRDSHAKVEKAYFNDKDVEIIVDLD
jgi:hypothetical protein